MSQFLSPMIFLKVGHKHKLSYLLQILLLMGMLTWRLGHSSLLLPLSALTSKGTDIYVAITAAFVACSSRTEKIYDVTCASTLERCFFVTYVTGVEHAGGKCRNIVRRNMESNHLLHHEELYIVIYRLKWEAVKMSVSQTFLWFSAWLRLLYEYFDMESFLF